MAATPAAVRPKRIQGAAATALPRRAADELAPFLKWAGGKRSLLPRLLPFVPATIRTYYEPFVGGGALFFELARQNRFRHATLADQNEELIRCYTAIKLDFTKVVRALETHRYEKEAFYTVRAQNPARLPDPARAARTIYLNQCCYNGLYRVNRAGHFNVPFGRYRNPRFLQPIRLRLAAEALQRADLVVSDFEDAVAGAGAEDFVYFDPPYVPVSATANFTSYGRAGFGPVEQERLARLMRRLGDAGVRTLLSNSDCPATRKLYRGLRMTKVEVRRAINSAADKRGAVAELIVRGFDYSC